jgi:hypothetical protein
MLRMGVVDRPIMFCTALLSEAAALQEKTVHWEWRGGDDVAMMMMWRSPLLHSLDFLPSSFPLLPLFPSFLLSAPSQREWHG